MIFLNRITKTNNILNITEIDIVQVLILRFSDVISPVYSYYWKLRKKSKNYLVNVPIRFNML